MFLRINTQNPDQRKIKLVVETLKNGGVIIYPTDSIYALGCDITNTKAIEKVCRIKNLNAKKANLSFICKDLSNLSLYSKNFENSVFKMMKRNLPGPFTFILQASKEVPKMLKNNKKTVGIRVPNNKIALSIIEGLGNPIISTSLHSDDKTLEYPTDPDEINNQFKKLVDVVIDGGIGNLTPSTIVDCTQTEPTIIRQGLGELI